MTVELLVSAMKTVPSSSTSRSSGRLVAKFVSNAAVPTFARMIRWVSTSSSSVTSRQVPVPLVAVIGVVSPAVAKRRRPSGAHAAM